MAAWKEAKEAAYYASIDNRSPIMEYPLHLEVIACWKYKKRHDIDSLASQKPILDLLVSLRVLEDDDTSHIASVLYKGVIGAPTDSIILRFYVN